MTIAERVKRGFFRLGLVGVGIGGIVAVVVVGHTISLKFGAAEAYCPDSYLYRTLQLDGHNDEAKLRAHCESRKIDWATEITRAPAAAPRQGYEQLVTEAYARRIRQISDGWQIAAFSLVVGFAWLSLMWVVGWLIRGFLRDG